MQRSEDKQLWALVLGASSGFGEAASLALAGSGMGIFGVHLDRKATLGHVTEIIERIRGMGRKALFFNVNAADESNRLEVVDTIQEQFRKEPGTVRVLLHSLAFGTLRSYIPGSEERGVGQKEMEMTLDVMAHSLVYWVQDLVQRGLMERQGRIFAMTSAGDVHAWPSYGAVSAAKAALEAHVRQLAVELAPMGITVNAIRAGVTDTPALRKIPGHEVMAARALERNPSGRLTEPRDVADAIVALASPKTQWMTGNVIGVDGGEEIAG